MTDHIKCEHCNNEASKYFKFRVNTGKNGYRIIHEALCLNHDLTMRRSFQKLSLEEYIISKIMDG